MPSADRPARVRAVAHRFAAIALRNRRWVLGAAVPAVLVLVPLSLVESSHRADPASVSAASVSPASASGPSASTTSASTTGSTAASTTSSSAPGDPPPQSVTPASQLNPTQRQRLSNQAGTAPAADQAPLIATYTVQAGDTLSGIAAQLGTDVASLEKINNLNDYSVLQPGQKLTALRMVGWLYQVRSGDTLSSIASATGATVDQLATVNDVNASTTFLQPGEQLVIPKDPTVTQPAAQVAAPSYGAGLIWPVHGIITSPFGMRPDPWTNAGSFFHNGIDIGVPMHTPVAAACSGRVIISGWDGGYGEAVKIACDNGLDTMYAHNSILEVSVGEQVQQGGLISYSGMTGNATGPHVHFGVERNGVWLNPLSYLP